jgi:uncharacterized repeat protein (TIGR02543 family)
MKKENIGTSKKPGTISSVFCFRQFCCWQICRRHVCRLFIVFFSLFIFSCSGPLQENGGNITISVGGGFNRSILDNEGLLRDGTNPAHFIHTITATDNKGKVQELELEPGGETVSIFLLALGPCTIVVQGWLEDELKTQGTTIVDIQPGPNGTVSIQMEFIATFNIIYRDVGDLAFTGTHGTDYPAKHTYGTASTLVNPTRDGYIFGGWFINSDGSGTVLTTLAADGYAAEITLYAKWNPITYAITYLDVGGGAFTGAHGTDYPTEHTYGTDTTLVSPTNDEYTFGGWFINSDGSGTALTTLAADGYVADITLYAKWNQITCTITYLDVGGAAFSGTHGTGYPTEHVYGTDTNLVSPTRDGHTFGGWFINSDGSGTALTILAAKDYKENITLYAKWYPSVGITLNFDINDQAPDPINITLSVSGTAPYSATATINLGNPTQYTGYEWYYNNGLLSSTSSVDLSASGTFDNILGIKLLTVVVVKDSKLYSADITVTVVE